MAEQEKWQWQEPGTAWKGVGLYHITLTITDRQPLLGTLVIPENDPTKARVNRTALGNGLVNCLLSIPQHHPEVQVLHFCLMPDHLHAVLAHDAKWYWSAGAGILAGHEEAGAGMDSGRGGFWAFFLFPE